MNNSSENFKYSIFVCYRNSFMQEYNTSTFNCNTLDKASDFIDRMKQKYSECIFEKYQYGKLVSKFY